MARVDISTYKDLIEKAAKKYGVDPKLVETIILQENGGLKTNSRMVDPNATSPKGAYGVAQLMPQTARALGVDRTKVDQNIEGAAKLIGQLQSRYGNNVTKIAAAYNAGEPAVNRNNGVPPYKETIDYVNNVVKAYGDKTPATSPASSAAAASSSLTGQAPVGGLKPYNPNTIPAVAQSQNAAAGPSTRSQPLTAAPAQSLTSDLQAPPTAQTGQQMIASAMPSAAGAPAPINTANNPAVLRAQEISGMFSNQPYLQAQRTLEAAAAAQQSNATNIAGLVANMPNMPNYDEIQKNQVSALQQLYSNSSTAVNNTFDQLVLQDQQRRQLVTTIQQRQNFDPLNPNSAWNKYNDTQALIARRLDATILAEQEVQDASIMDKPGLFLERMLFGNRYTDGASKLKAQSDKLDGVVSNLQGQLDSQTKVAAAMTLQDPQIMRDRLNADLQLAGIQKDIGIAQARAPLEAFQAQTQGVSALASLYGVASDSQTGVANTQIKAQEVMLQGQDAQMKAAMLPLQVESQVIGLESAKQGLVQQQAQTQAIPLQQQAQQIGVQQAAIQLAKDIQLAPQQVADQQLASMATTAETQAKLPIVKAKLAAVKALETSGQLQTAAGYAALTDYNNAIADYQTSYAKASTGAGAKAIQAGNVQNEGTIRLAPITENLTRKEAETKFEEYKAAENDAAILQQGWTAIGLPPQSMPSADMLKGAGYSKGVRPALIAASAGGRVAMNSGKAAEVLQELGATITNSKYPALSLTVGNAHDIASRLANADGAAEAGRGKEALDMLDQSIVVKEMKRIQNTPVGIASAPTASTIYGLLPSNAVAPYVKSQGGKAIADRFAQIEAERKGSGAGSYADMVTEASKALDVAGIKGSVQKAAAISDYFAGARAANNNLRGYNLLGVPEHGAVLVKIDRLDVGLSSITGYGDATYDLSSQVDVTRLLTISKGEVTMNAAASIFNDVTGAPLFREDLPAELFGYGSQADRYPWQTQP